MPNTARVSRRLLSDGQRHRTTSMTPDTNAPAPIQTISASAPRPGNRIHPPVADQRVDDCDCSLHLPSPSRGDTDEIGEGQQTDQVALVVEHEHCVVAAAAELAEPDSQ
jgi:hypothetical protein